VGGAADLNVTELARSIMKTYLPRSWINPKLTAGESKIHGEGVFASVPIARGEKLMEFGGEKITGAQANNGNYRECSVWLIADDTYLALPVTDPHASLDENLNHSCDPNAWLTDEVTLTARRNIAAGEEVTLDQGTWNFDESEYTWDQADCACGSQICRKRLTESDWQRSDVQQRYEGHFHPIIEIIIDGRQR
jgi:hypothetical protein